MGLILMTYAVTYSDYAVKTVLLDQHCQKTVPLNVTDCRYLPTHSRVEDKGVEYIFIYS